MNRRKDLKAEGVPAPVRRAGFRGGHIDDDVDKMTLFREKMIDLVDNVANRDHFHCVGVAYALSPSEFVDIASKVFPRRFGVAIYRQLT